MALLHGVRLVRQVSRPALRQCGVLSKEESKSARREHLEVQSKESKLSPSLREALDLGKTIAAASGFKASKSASRHPFSIRWSLAGGSSRERHIVFGSERWHSWGECFQALDKATAPKRRPLPVSLLVGWQLKRWCSPCLSRRCDQLRLPAKERQI